LKRKFFEKKKSKENHCPKIQKMKKKKKKKKKKKVLFCVLQLGNLRWIKFLLLGVLVRLYLDDMALEANILLLLLLE
jgi:hypothetical protein